MLPSASEDLLHLQERVYAFGSAQTLNVAPSLLKNMEHLEVVYSRHLRKDISSYNQEEPLS